MISARITRYCDGVQLIGNGQAGLRKKFSTSDHIFSLHVLITKVVDYQKAFDNVPRIQLWYKLLACGVNGNTLNVVKSFYCLQNQL